MVTHGPLLLSLFQIQLTWQWTLAHQTHVTEQSSPFEAELVPYPVPPLPSSAPTSILNSPLPTHSHRCAPHPETFKDRGAGGCVKEQGNGVRWDVHRLC